MPFGALKRAVPADLEWVTKVPVSKAPNALRGTETGDFSPLVGSNCFQSSKAPNALRGTETSPHKLEDTPLYDR
jgi:hypothetical protein